jgi:acetyl-CoA C-acetyltransferase
VVRSARDAYRQAGIDDPRTALSLAEVHDCFTPTEIVLMIGPVGVVEKLFGRMGLGFDDLELIELNEAFAVQVLAVLAGWGVKLDDVEDRLNVNGSGISLGHPIGATGVRILATMLHELRRRGGGLALETMCIGGGQGIAAIFRGAPP